MTLLAPIFNVILTASIILATWSLWWHRVEQKKARLLDCLLPICLLPLVALHNCLVKFEPTLLALDIAVVGAVFLIWFQYLYYRYFCELFEAYRLESWHDSNHDSCDPLAKW